LRFEDGTTAESADFDAGHADGDLKGAAKTVEE
jgi:hypothetical protein